MAEASFNRICAEVAGFTHTMAGLQSTILTLVRCDIGLFLKKTNELTNQMNWQGWTTIGLTSLGVSLAIAGALIPKSAPAGNAPTVDSRLGANAGANDSVKDIMKKLTDNDFLRTTCKTTSKFFNGVAPAADVLFRGTTTEIESKKKIYESINIPREQSTESSLQQQIQSAQQAVTRLLDSKAKGG